MAASDEDTETSRRGTPVRNYLIFLAWCGPAVMAATFAQAVLVPMMKNVIEVSPTHSDTMEDVGKIVAVLPDILLFYSRIFLIVVGVLVVILELAAKWWPRHRRTCLMIVAWLVNVAVLIGLCILASCILVFAES